MNVIRKLLNKYGLTKYNQEKLFKLSQNFMNP